MRDFVNNYIEDKLYEYEDSKTNKYDLAYLIMEVAFADATLTYSTQESINKRTPAPQAHGFNHGLGAANK